MKKQILWHERGMNPTDSTSRKNLINLKKKREQRTGKDFQD